MTRHKIIVEHNEDGYVAYPVGLKGVVVGQGDTCEEAITDVKFAIRAHTEAFGKDAIEEEEAPAEVFVSEIIV